MTAATGAPTPEQRRVLRRLANGWTLYGWWNGRCRFGRDGRYYGWAEKAVADSLLRAGWIWRGEITEAGRRAISAQAGGEH